MEIMVIYKNGHYFPQNDTARIICSLIKKPTISPASIILLEAIGHTFKFMGGPSAPHVPGPRGRPAGMQARIWAPTGDTNTHKRPPLRVVVGAELQHDYLGKVFKISMQQRRLIRSHFCGRRDCACHKGGVSIVAATGEYALRAEFLRDFT